MNNVIKLAKWRRTPGRVQEPMVLVQDCGRHKDVERVRQTILPVYQVTAVFAAGEVSFSLSINNTFADLADRLDHLGERHSGMPVAVYFKPYRTGRLNSAPQ